MAEAPPHAINTFPSDDARQAIVARWRRRSMVVAFWRIILPLSIFAITLGLAGWIVARGMLDRPDLAQGVISNQLMTKFRFYGRDKHDRAYLLTAMTAVRDARNEHKITLANPNFNLGGGSVRAKQGVYIDNSTKILLHGDVLAINSDGSRMQTQDAEIDTRTGVVSNTNVAHDGGLQIETNMGKITANDYTIAKNGAVTFRGRVRGVINGR